MAAIIPTKQYKPTMPPAMPNAQPTMGIHLIQSTANPVTLDITKYNNIAITNVTMFLGFTASFIGKNEFIINYPPHYAFFNLFIMTLYNAEIGLSLKPD